MYISSIIYYEDNIKLKKEIFAFLLYFGFALSLPLADFMIKFAQTQFFIFEKSESENGYENG